MYTYIKKKVYFIETIKLPMEAGMMCAINREMFQKLS